MTPDKTYWTSTEAGEWKLFLNTDTGKKLLLYLVEGEPTLLKKGDTNEILIRSGEVSQHKEVLSTLLYLTGAETNEQLDIPPSPNYPSLTDDDAWGFPDANPNPQE